MQDRVRMCLLHTRRPRARARGQTASAARGFARNLLGPFLPREGEAGVKREGKQEETSGT